VIASKAMWRRDHDEGVPHCRNEHLS